MSNQKKITPGGVDSYIESCPPDVRDTLQKMKAVITDVAPDATETVSYFQIPGYAYEGYEYNGMFVWFSYKSPYVRLHVIPPVIEAHRKQLAEYTTTKSVVSFPVDEELPIPLIKELVEASIKVMKDKSKQSQKNT